MTRDEWWEAAKSQLPQRVASLRSRPYVELLQLPSHDATKAVHDDSQVVWTVYRDVLEDSSLKVVVQLSTKPGTLLGLVVGYAIADGFRIDPNGVTTSLTKEELYEST